MLLYPKKSLTNSRVQRFSPGFFSRNCIALVSGIRSTLRWFLYNLWEEGCVFFFKWKPFSTICWKDLHSLLNYSGTSVEICWPYMCRSFSGLDSFPLIYVSVLKPTLNHLNYCKKACFPLYCESLSWFSFKVLFVREESKKLSKAMEAKSWLNISMWSL